MKNSVPDVVIEPAKPTVLVLVEQMQGRLESAGLSFADGFGHGTVTAFDEAAWLVLWRLGLPLDGLDAAAHLPVSPADHAAALQLVDTRIATRKPTAYLTNEAWLVGVPFYVDERVIIPRSLIAELIESGSIDPWLSKATHRVLDLCTGNGSLGVLAAMAYPDITVEAADISPDALAVARINIDRHQLADRITTVESDCLAACAGNYDLILCNPPYVNSASMQALPAEFRAEPALALAGGSDGMDFIRRLFLTIAGQMNENTVLVLEIGNERANFESAFPRLEPVWLETSAGDDQVLLLTREQLV